MRTDMHIYADPESGVRLVVERDIPGHPRFSAYWGEDGMITLEEINAAIRRLMVEAKLLPDSEEA
jgi:hypothetical protein